MRDCSVQNCGQPGDGVGPTKRQVNLSDKADNAGYVATMYRGH